MTWLAVVGGSVLCYLAKLAGMAVPPSLLEGERVRRVALLVPIGLLATLSLTGTFATGDELTIDGRAAGLVAALAALAIRLPFVIVVVGACAATAAVRAVGG